MLRLALGGLNGNFNCIFWIGFGFEWKFGYSFWSGVMKIDNIDGNDIVLEHGVIQVDANWVGGSQVELVVTLFIDKHDKHYDCNSIENAFSEYYRIIESI